MSGDVQPRKRKDKKKKRDDEASHGVHITKMGSDDVLLHVHEEHGTGGHWCAKIIFFSLMAILMGLVCLIILENRGLSDVDTPLSESRFSNYFDGWVDEHRGAHDDHHDKHGSVEHGEHDDEGEHDEEDEENDHDEPFEEEADQSEGDEEPAEDEDNNVMPEEEDENDDENVTAEEDADADADDEEDEEEVENDEEENVTNEEDDNVTAEEADDENATGEDENITKEATGEEELDEDDDDDEDNDGNRTEEDDDNATQETSKPNSQAAQDKDDNDNDPFDEEEDDGTFDSLEKIVDNDAAELELLKEKARQQASAAAASKQNAASNENDAEDEADNAPSWASSQIKPKSGGGGPQSLEDDDLDLFEQELRRANDEMMRERYGDALNSFDRLIQRYGDEPQVYLGKAQTLDHYAEQRKSNRLLMDAIAMYETYLEFSVKDAQLQEYRAAGERCVERMRFLGNYQQCLHIHNVLIEKFPQEASMRIELAITFLMLNRLSDAKRVLQETLKRWPRNGLALVHYGFVLKQLDQDYHNASAYLRQGIESNAKGTQDGRFYFQLGEALQRLGKQNEAVEVFRKGAALKLFPSAYQRSLYNEPNLKAQPFWSLEATTYGKFFKKLQDNWLAIQAEGLYILSKDGYFLNESESLKSKGDWKQFELFARGQQKRENCLKTPITCSLINEFPAARDCRRGQVKFSVIHAGTHVWPHCGPTNCRLRAHLGLVVPNGTRIRVADEERSWQEGKFLIFDDSFEHEVWHEGQSLRLVLIVDVWHPDLIEQQRLSLSHI